MRIESIPADGWLVEKTVNALRQVAQAAWKLKRLKIDSESKSVAPEEEIQHDYSIARLDEVIDDLYASLFDLTKIAEAFYKTGEWRSFDAEHILKRGEIGLTDVLIKYGLSEYSRPLSTKEVIAKLNRVKALAEGARGENRTFIFDELIVIASYDSIAKAILKLLDPVSMGVKPWEVFQEEVRGLLTDLRETDF